MRINNRILPSLLAPTTRPYAVTALNGSIAEMTGSRRLLTREMDAVDNVQRTSRTVR